MKRPAPQAQTSKMFMLCLLAAILFQQSSADYSFKAYTTLSNTAELQTLLQDLPQVYECDPASGDFDDVADTTNLLSMWQAAQSAECQEVDSLTVNCVYWGFEGDHAGKFIIEYTVVVDCCDVNIPDDTEIDIDGVEYDVSGTYIFGGKGPCEEHVHTTPTPPQCRGVNYDPLTHVCCGNKLYTLEDDHACCDNSYYDETTHVCCGIKIFALKDHHACCANRYYDEEKRECCGGTTVSDPNKFSCCGTRKYKPRIKVCCNEECYPVKKWKCCTGSPDYPWYADGNCPVPLVEGENPTYAFNRAYVKRINQYRKVKIPWSKAWTF